MDKKENLTEQQKEILEKLVQVTNEQVKPMMEAFKPMTEAFEKLNERLEPMRKIGEALSEAFEDVGELVETDPIFKLIWTIVHGDYEALRKLVLDYYLYNHNLSYSERERVSQQLTKLDIQSISENTILIWAKEFPIPYLRYYLTLSPEERKKKVTSIMGSECRKELLGEISREGTIPYEEVEEFLPANDEEPAYLDIPKMGPIPTEAIEDLLAIVIKQDDSSSNLLRAILNPKEIALLRDMQNGFAQGFDFSLKKGHSFRQYWGKDYPKKIKALERVIKKITEYYKRQYHS